MKAGELCAGYGGLALAVEEVFGARPAWFAEYEAAPSKVLAAHWPDVPNHGDMTRIDWAAVEPVDIISGGTPCQDLSHAGKRAGMSDGTRSNLWVQMREAVAVIRPRFVVWENVRGAYSAAADSAVEPCPGCVGDGSAVNLRALGRVLGDLSELGYDAAWHGLTAASVGAPHGRFRIFVLAWDAAYLDGFNDGRAAVGAAGDRRRSDAAPSCTPADADSLGHERGRGARGRGTGPADSGQPATDASRDGWDEGRAQSTGLIGRSNAAIGRDAAADTFSGGRDGWSPEPVGCEVGRVAATRSGAGPVADTDGDGIRVEPVTESGRGRSAIAANAIQWGIYAPAIRRWERVLGRPAPAPTETGPKGAQRLSPRFVEWLMGLPTGWVTDCGLTRNDQLKALGNGVVPQQAAAALRYLLAATTDARAAA